MKRSEATKTKRMLKEIEGALSNSNPLPDGTKVVSWKGSLTKTIYCAEDIKKYADEICRQGVKSTEGRNENR